MKSACWSTFKSAAVVFALAVAVHFAAPPTASAYCYCSTPVKTTPTEAGTGTSCDGATAWLNELLLNDQDCGGQDACDVTLVVTTQCFLRSDGYYEVDGHDRYLCNEGTTCP